MNPKNKELVEITAQRVIANLQGSWDLNFNEDERRRIYEFVERQNIDGRVEVYFLKYIDKYEDMLCLESNHYQLRIVFMTRKRDGQKIFGINCCRTPEFKFKAFFRDHGIPDEITSLLMEKVNINSASLVCVCKRIGKFEELKASEGVPVTVVSGKLVSMPVSGRSDIFSFYVLGNDIVIHLPTRHKTITWYNFEP